MLASVALAALAASYAGAYSLNCSGSGYTNYTTVPGYFLQDDPSTNATTFNYTLNNFGLINRTYPATKDLPYAGHLTQWQKFAIQVEALNRQAPSNTVYKVLFMGRHGEGYHNAAESFYGTPAWNCYWAELTGNSTTTWEDAKLTSNGILQARIAHNFWKHEMETQKIPVPQSYYTSPLSRCLDTANITYAGLNLPRRHPFIPTVKEFLREGISLHTCDRRGNKTYIHHTYPSFKFEKGFNEYDELWNGVTAESDSSHQKRELELLDDVFSSDDNTWISFTSHSGTIATILQVLGHRNFSLATGSIIPVLVEAKFLPASDAPATTVLPFTTSTWCHNGPPVTSNASLSQGCVCSATTGPLPSLSTQAPYVSGQTAPINEFTTTTTVAAAASPSGSGYQYL
ncbi:Hypothetical predicted protein [Lecanosticta acicola]|uniref:Phosphoglycerate mutase-like protein n=1 Tax=Lecanosticta acicola TaxID=111012 RepID=A0AAI8YS64_9PEZI|nr:Hypothetical predicted protein [Lecanosticta acicola]